MYSVPVSPISYDIKRGTLTPSVMAYEMGLAGTDHIKLTINNRKVEFNNFYL